MVEDQETGVHPVGHEATGAGQGDVHRVRVAAEIVARLEQRDPGLTGQRVRGGQARNARADDGHAPHRAPRGNDEGVP